jgi:hypothetical protein
MVGSFRGLLVIDAEGFSRHPDAELPRLHEEIRHAAAQACERSELRAAWEGARVLQSTGDGLFAVLPHEAVTALIDPFPRYLQESLAEAAPRLRADGLALRLRVAVHAGLVGDEDPVTAGISTATNEVHRLVNCEPARLALRDSAPDVTFVALVVSSVVFEAFVRGRHTGLHPDQFTTVRATVKQFDQPAHLHVPVPSYREPGAGPGTPSAPPREADLPVGQVSIRGDQTQNVIGSQVHGGIRQERS